MRPAIQIVAAGARAPVGATAEGVAAAIRAGIRRMHAVQLAALPGELESFVARDPLLDPDDWDGTTRMRALATAALTEIVRKVSAAMKPGAAVPVLLGLPEERPGWTTADVSRVVAALEAVGGARLSLEISPRLVGHASVLQSLKEAAGRLASDEGCPLVIVGGVDSYLDIETLAWLRGEGRWFEEGSRNGFIPGEAAAFVALTDGARARRLGLTAAATLHAVAAASETRVIGGDANVLGEALTSAVHGALASSEGPVDEIWCDINGERYRSEEWGFAALRLGPALRDASAYHTAARSCGDTGAATGALGVLGCLQAWRRRYAQGPRALIWGGSDSGLRVAALLEQVPSGVGEGGGR